MTISIWRYSHLALAITASVFILLASVTGIILAFQPISEQLQPYKVEDLKTISHNLNISYKSVANYQTSIKKKLSIKNALDFYNLAKENNLLN